jgi:hypothetical protein
MQLSPALCEAALGVDYRWMMIYLQEHEMHQLQSQALTVPSFGLVAVRF